MDFHGNKFNFLVHLLFTAKYLSKLAKLSSAYSYYGITGPKTSSATALPAHRAPPPLSEAKLACRNNWADLTFEGRRSSLYVTNQFFAWGFLLTLTKKSLNLGKVYRWQWRDSFSQWRITVWTYCILDLLFVPCGGVSWLPVSFLLHVKYTPSYRIVSSQMTVFATDAYRTRTMLMVAVDGVTLHCFTVENFTFVAYLFVKIYVRVYYNLSFNYPYKM